MTKIDIEKVLLKRIMIVEAIVNAVIGMGITFVAQLIIYPFVGLEVNLNQNLMILFIFTFISILRNLLFRKIFHNVKKKIKKDIKDESTIFG